MTLKPSGVSMPNTTPRPMKASAESILQDVANSIDEHLEESKSVNVFSMPARMPIVNNFALIFHNTFLFTIDDYNLSRNDIRVMLKIIDLMKFGNLVKLSWADVARSLGIPEKNIIRHIKKLRDAHLLIDDEGGNTYLNPQIIAKGKFLQKNGDETLIQLLDLGAKAMEDTAMSPNIITPNIRKKIRKKQEQHLNQKSLLDPD